ncbi:MAG TPA: ABC transporter permease subunit, partial [Anaerolineae bacterium]|nr:ABC transporter permease subunit [Anaerolineae bacterium]
RKKPSAKQVWGNLAAVLGGDFIYSKAAAIVIEADRSKLFRRLNNTTLKMIEGQALELMHTLNAKERQLFWKMRVPYSLPYLFTSFKITSSAAVLGAIIGEWMGAWRGLGAVIVQAMYNMRGDQLWAAMTVATLLSILAYVLTAIAERIFIPWHESVKQAEVGG